MKASPGKLKKISVNDYFLDRSRFYIYIFQYSVQWYIAKYGHAKYTYEIYNSTGKNKIKKYIEIRLV